MKRIGIFLFGIIMLGFTFAALYLTGAIYDAGDRTTIDTYFFQPNNLSTDRPGEIQTPDEMGDMRIMNLLVDRYITEYFYVVPDRENIARRTRNNSILAQMSSAPVFTQWINTMANEIDKMAGEKSMRTAAVINDITRPAGGDYWQVDYELHTWRTPNDLDMPPEISRGTLFMKIRFEPGIRDFVVERGVHKYLDAGGDPASLFKFRVYEIVAK